MKIEELNDRVNRLEVVNRNLFRALFLLVGVFVLACFLGANYNQFCQHRANRFALVDSCGIERATLEFENGEPVLCMVGSSGNTQVRLGITEVHADSASLYLQNSTKDSFMSISASSKTGSSSIEFGGSQKRINLRTGLPGLPAKIYMTDENGNATAKLPESD